MGDGLTEGVCDSAKNCNAPEFESPTGGFGPAIGLAACSWSLNKYNQEEVGYRAFLRDKLVAKGIKMVYVGSVSVVEGLAYEGHSLFTINDVDYCVQNADWLQKAQPHIILLHIGTNDVGWGHAPDKIAADLRKLLEHIYNQLPKTTYVVVAQIIPMWSQAQEVWVKLPTLANNIIDPYNAKIPGVVDQFRAEGKNVLYVDMSGVIRSDSDLYDGITPIPAAYERMADVWFNKIVEILTQRP